MPGTYSQSHLMTTKGKAKKFDAEQQKSNNINHNSLQHCMSEQTGAPL